MGWHVRIYECTLDALFALTSSTSHGRSNRLRSCTIGSYTASCLLKLRVSFTTSRRQRHYRHHHDITNTTANMGDEYAHFRPRYDMRQSEVVTREPRTRRWSMDEPQSTGTATPPVPERNPARMTAQLPTIIRASNDFTAEVTSAINNHPPVLVAARTNVSDESNAGSDTKSFHTMSSVPDSDPALRAARP